MTAVGEGSACSHCKQPLVDGRCPNATPLTIEDENEVECLPPLPPELIDAMSSCDFCTKTWEDPGHDAICTRPDRCAAYDSGVRCLLAAGHPHHHEVPLADLIADRDRLAAENARLKIFETGMLALRERAKSFALSPGELLTRFLRVEAEFDAMEDERDSLRSKLAERERERDAAVREADRRHGVPVEGDYVCPTALECASAIADAERLRPVYEAAQRYFAANYNDNPDDERGLFMDTIAAERAKECSYNECQIRDKCTRPTACRSLVQLRRNAAIDAALTRSKP